MGRIGIICPVDKRARSDADCLRCRTGVHPLTTTGEWCDLSYEMLSGMFDGSGRVSAHVSATQLCGCRRKVVLEAAHDYYADPLKLFPAWRGTMGHAAAERYPEPGCIYEQRFELAIPGHKKPFTGQIDKIDVARKQITDFKTKDKLPDGPDIRHVWQLNVYRHLVMHGWPQQAFEGIYGGERWIFPVGVPAEIEIDTLVLVYWSMKGVVQYECPVWTHDATWEFIKDGYEEIIDDELPPIPEGYDPFHGPLCTQWCPVNQHCVAALTAFNPTKLKKMAAK